MKRCNALRTCNIQKTEFLKHSTTPATVKLGPIRHLCNSKPNSKLKWKIRPKPKLKSSSIVIKRNCRELS